MEGMTLCYVGLANSSHENKFQSVKDNASFEHLIQKMSSGGRGDAIYGMAAHLPPDDFWKVGRYGMETS